MFGFDTVDSLVADLKNTSSKLEKLGTAKLQRAAYLQELSEQIGREASRAGRVANKLRALIE